MNTKLIPPHSTPWKRANTDWMRDARWGVMIHFLSDSPTVEAATATDEWNRRVDEFDVPRLVSQLREVGAGYLLFTLGQCSGFFCSPNATYDRIVDEKPSRLSRRDLMGDLAEALAPEGIRLLAYLPSHAPGLHRRATEALRCLPPWKAVWHGDYSSSQPSDDRLAEFQHYWEAIVREWSLRWGNKVHGWWVDGCYHSDKMYRHPDAPNFRSFAEAMKAGNPDALVAFNPGVPIPMVCHSEFEDYTAGEVNVMVTPYQHGDFHRTIDGAQVQVLSFLGPWWSTGEPRYPDNLVVEYTRYINSLEGAVTWDVPCLANGEIPESYMRQLGKIRVR